MAMVGWADTRLLLLSAGGVRAGDVPGVLRQPAGRRAADVRPRVHLLPLCRRRVPQHERVPTVQVRRSRALMLRRMHVERA